MAEVPMEREKRDTPKRRRRRTNMVKNHPASLFFNTLLLYILVS
jgi:hypothetical protein